MGYKGVWCLIRWKGVIIRWVSSALFLGAILSALSLLAMFVWVLTLWIVMWCLEVLI